MNGLDYQIHLLRQATELLDRSISLTDEEASTIQVSLAHATALVSRAVQRQLSVRLNSSSNVSNTTAATTAAASAKIETLASVAAALGISVEVLRSHNPQLAATSLRDSDPLPSNAMLTAPSSWRIGQQCTLNKQQPQKEASAHPKPGNAKVSAASSSLEVEEPSGSASWLSPSGIEGGGIATTTATLSSSSSIKMEDRDDAATTMTPNHSSVSMSVVPNGDNSVASRQQDGQRQQQQVSSGPSGPRSMLPSLLSSLAETTGDAASMSVCSSTTPFDIHVLPQIKSTSFSQYNPREMSNNTHASWSASPPPPCAPPPVMTSNLFEPDERPCEDQHPEPRAQVQFSGVTPERAGSPPASAAAFTTPFAENAKPPNKHSQRRGNSTSSAAVAATAAAAADAEDQRPPPPPPLPPQQHQRQQLNERHAHSPPQHHQTGEGEEMKGAPHSSPISPTTSLGSSPSNQRCSPSQIVLHTRRSPQQASNSQGSSMATDEARDREGSTSAASETIANAQLRSTVLKPSCSSKDREPSLRSLSAVSAATTTTTDGEGGGEGECFTTPQRSHIAQRGQSGGSVTVSATGTGLREEQRRSSSTAGGGGSDTQARTVSLSSEGTRCATPEVLPPPPMPFSSSSALFLSPPARFRREEEGVALRSTERRTVASMGKSGGAGAKDSADMTAEFFEDDSDRDGIRHRAKRDDRPGHRVHDGDAGGRTTPHGWHASTAAMEVEEPATPDPEIPMTLGRGYRAPVVPPQVSPRGSLSRSSRERSSLSPLTAAGAAAVTANEGGQQQQQTGHQSLYPVKPTDHSPLRTRDDVTNNNSNNIDDISSSSGVAPKNSSEVATAAAGEEEETLDEGLDEQQGLLQEDAEGMYEEGEEDEFDTIAGIAETYNASIEQILAFNPYLSAYGVNEPLPPDLPIVLPAPDEEDEESGDEHMDESAIDA